MGRFSAFAPLVESIEQRRRSKPVAAFTLPVDRPATTRESPLEEIQLIEDEWRERVQPRGVVEETLCAQLAHATWHLRSLQRAEREAIAAAARERCFNGDTAVSLMTWRRSAETAIQEALVQLKSYRDLPGADQAPQESSQNLLALALGVGQSSGVSGLCESARRSPE